VAFSGDLVQGGSDPELYQAFLEMFDKSLDSFGISRSRRICVPGNHDISRKSLEKKIVMQLGVLKQMEDERSFNDNLAMLSDAVLNDKFKNYSDCEAKFAEYTCCSNGVGGSGWSLGNDLDIYCLNTALCSYGGLEDPQGNAIRDFGILSVDTRGLYEWLQKSTAPNRILMLHHPLNWLAPWAEAEIQKIVAAHFKVYLCGHVHGAAATYSSQGDRGVVSVVAPPLFTRKSELLGYSFVTIDTETGEVAVDYRQWTRDHKFVLGSGLSSTDDGKRTFRQDLLSGPPTVEPKVAEKSPSPETVEVLRQELAEATTFYSSKRQIWIDRDVATHVENSKETSDDEFVSLSDISTQTSSCVIRAPEQFGLTSFGRKIALEHYLRNNSKTVLAVMDSSSTPPHRRGLIAAMEQRCAELRISIDQLAGLILDNWQSDKAGKKLVREIAEEFPQLRLVILQDFNDVTTIASMVDSEEIKGFKKLYLWSLNRARVRQLVSAYVKDLTHLDDDAVTTKIVGDIDALNIHRTPSNCLLLLKLIENSFDDSPVNRTDVISRVLSILFYQFADIPRYASRPDLKDCEYGLGYLSEWLIRSQRISFTKDEFYSKVREYLKLQLLDSDTEVLFAFLVSEGILVRKYNAFEFRFIYWLYYFAAHRMHHSKEFSEFILSDRRYCSFPEVIEFYAGIDRRGSDAVGQLVNDLRAMNSEFEQRTQVPVAFNPLQFISWKPTPESAKALMDDIANGIAISSLPSVVKDAIADRNYDRARPYRQEIAKFMSESSLIQMVDAMKAAARALRNSDHVHPQLKLDLLEEVVKCWGRVCQTLFLIAPLLGERMSYVFEGMAFVLDPTFDAVKDFDAKVRMIITCVPGNILAWFQSDLFSKKMSTLFSSYIEKNRSSLGELLVLLLMVRQRSPGWEREVEAFIVRSSKNSSELLMLFNELMGELQVSFANEESRQHMRRLAAMSLAKHVKGAKHPNNSLVAEMDKKMREMEGKKKVAGLEDDAIDANP
jgi:hypothetical protein